jgi:hypothetical protein
MFRVEAFFLCEAVQRTRGVKAHIIMNDDQQDATIFYLFISSLLYMFRANLSSIIRSSRYRLPILLLAGIVDEMDPRYQPAVISVDNT